MKKQLGLFLAAGLGLALAGCFVPSVYPFYTEKDLISDDGLVGTWTAKDENSRDNVTWTFAKAGDAQYKFSINKETETNVYYAHLFKLKEYTFMDCLLVQTEKLTIPPHYLARVVQIQPALKLATFNIDWLEGYVQTNPAAIQHIIACDDPGDTNTAHIVLTAETKELQRFVLKHAGNTNAWGDLDEMKRANAKGDH